jgi:hypothetical protein
VERGDHQLGRSVSGMWKINVFKAVAPACVVKDQWIDTREQVLNVLIVCRWYKSGEPSNWLSTKTCLFPTASLAVVREKLGTDPRIRQPSSCGLYREPFFSGAVDLYKSVDNFMKGCYVLTAWDTHRNDPYVDWACDACGVWVEFSPAWYTLIRIVATLEYEYRLFAAVIT